MAVKRKYKFKANVWLVGFYQGNEILGRTYTQNEKDYAIIITETCVGKVVDFEYLEDIKILNVRLRQPIITTSLQNKKRLTAIEKLISEILITINN